MTITPEFPNNFGFLKEESPNLFSQIPEESPNLFDQIPEESPNLFGQIPEESPNVYTDIAEIATKNGKLKSEMRKTRHPSYYQYKRLIYRHLQIK